MGVVSDCGWRCRCVGFVLKFFRVILGEMSGLWTGTDYLPACVGCERSEEGWVGFMCFARNPDRGRSGTSEARCVSLSVCGPVPFKTEEHEPAASQTCNTDRDN